MDTALYLQTFVEAAWSASIIPLGHDTAFFAMKAFGGYPMVPAVALAVAGALVGQCFNWWLGKKLLQLKDHSQRQIIAPPHYNKASTVFNRYGWWLLLFSWFPLVNFVSLAAGFLNAPLRLVLPLLLAGQIYHYGQYLLH